MQLARAVMGGLAHVRRLTVAGPDQWCCILIRELTWIRFPFTPRRPMAHETEVLTMAADLPRQSVEPIRAVDRITVTLTPETEAILQQLQDRTGLSRTDLVNRAITLYE